MVPDSALCRDFDTLVERSSPNRKEIDRLVVLKPQRMVLRQFDAVEQVFSMDLFDSQGRDIRLEVRYSEQEEDVIRMLEALKAQPADRPPVFFGILYREGELLKCYPIEYFKDWEVGP